MRAATGNLLPGRKMCFPEGVRIGRLSRWTAMVPAVDVERYCRRLSAVGRDRASRSPPDGNVNALAVWVPLNVDRLPEPPHRPLRACEQDSKDTRQLDQTRMTCSSIQPSHPRSVCASALDFTAFAKSRREACSAYDLEAGRTSEAAERAKRRCPRRAIAVRILV